MWRCSSCQESVPGNFEVCWSCGTSRSSGGDRSQQLNNAPLPEDADEASPSVLRKSRRWGNTLLGLDFWANWPLAAIAFLGFLAWLVWGAGKQGKDEDQDLHGAVGHRHK